MDEKESEYGFKYGALELMLTFFILKYLQFQS